MAWPATNENEKISSVTANGIGPENVIAIATMNFSSSIHVVPSNVCATSDAMRARSTFAMLTIEMWKNVTT